jgi:hypothetical protein
MTDKPDAKPYSETWWKQLHGDGEPAMNFHSNARVWGEMAVHDVVCRALASVLARAERAEARAEALEKWGVRAEQALLFADSGGNFALFSKTCEELVLEWAALAAGEVPDDDR